VGFLEVAPAELAGEGPEAHGTLSRPERACYLAFAATLPESRGAGAGGALTQAALAWAHDAGYTSIVTDWRVANLLASRFWPRRGFRTTFLRLYRSIP
jgi:ribosomal protein S18 acetylase RimI-like enzyme